MPLGSERYARSCVIGGFKDSVLAPSVGGLDPSDVDIIMGCREKTRGIKSVEFACMSRVFSMI